jgi:hypothetical protein
MTDSELVVFQDVHIGSLGDFFDLFHKTRNFLSVELMVAQDIDDGLLRKGRQDPSNSVYTSVNITGEHNNVCISASGLKRRKLQVEITQNVHTHTRSDMIGSRASGSIHPLARDNVQLR